MDYQQFIDSVSPEDIAKAEYYRKVLGTNGYKFPEQGAPLEIKNNQLAMRQWAAPVKQQNKAERRNLEIEHGKNLQDRIDPNTGEYLLPKDPSRRVNDARFHNKYTQTNPNGYVGQHGKGEAPYLPGSDGRQRLINRLAGPVGALPMVAPEALGMIGAAQEAQRQGVNPIVNWLQRMTPVPIVAPTGNGGEVYNYQSGQRYTPEY